MQKIVVFLCIAALTGMSGVTYAITIDGTFSNSEWAGNYTSEDTDTNRNRVGPGYGGQAFDVEYLGVFSDHTTLSIVLQSGFNFADGVRSGGTRYTPGDIFLKVDNVWKYAIDFDAGLSYDLYKVNPANIVKPNPYQQSGPFELNTTGLTKEFISLTDTFHFVFNDVDGGLDGIADAQDAFGNPSYVLEGAIGLNLLGLSGGEEVTAHWTMSCGNDVLEHTTTVPTPEPVTLILMGIGIAGLAGGLAIRKMRNKRD